LRSKRLDAQRSKVWGGGFEGTNSLRGAVKKRVGLIEELRYLGTPDSLLYQGQTRNSWKSISEKVRLRKTETPNRNGLFFGGGVEERKKSPTFQGAVTEKNWQRRLKGEVTETISAWRGASESDEGE